MSRPESIRQLQCACCGKLYRGRQWWNQDTGYGLGDCCVSFCGVDPAAGENESYGVPGVHFLIDQDNNPKRKT